MTATTSKIDILHTKLYRPPLSSDLVAREHLLERLKSAQQRALTLVSAPAGYGKSTLISQWLETCSCPVAWLSLDAEDSDLRRFLLYGVAAIQSLFPDFGHEALSLLRAVDLPARGILIPTVLNELAQIREPCVLVLDDYHRLHDTEVHDLIREGLAHPQLFLHLVIITRHDPPLPLSRLRALGQVVEIREPDLRFSVAETRTFLHKTTGAAVEEAIVERIEAKTEGWVTGLRLFMLSIRNCRDVSPLLERLPEESHYVTAYLFEEVLSQQSPDMQQCLLNTALLDRFCGPLCEAICLDGTCAGSSPPSWKLGAHLTQQGLFTIALDEQQLWFRYHHLFQKFLQRRLQTQRSPQDIAAQHTRAGRWFESQGMIDEALRHALAAEDLPAALRLVARHRHTFINQEEWPRLASWLCCFPDEFVDRSPDLLMLKAWLLHHRVRMSDMAGTLDRVKAERDKLPQDPLHKRLLRGEYAVLRSHQHETETDILQARTMAQQALQLLPDNALYARSLAVTLLSLSFQKDGDVKNATATVYRLLGDESLHRTSHHTRLLMTLGFIHWLEADLPKLQQIATQHLTLSRELRLTESLAYARYLLSVYHYERNELTQAEQYATALVNPAYPLVNRNSVSGIIFLALISLATGHADEAERMSDRLLTSLLEQGHPLLLNFMWAFKAELALRRGKLPEAVSWSQQHALPPLLPVTRYYLPHLTAVKTLLAQHTPDSLRQAAELLSEVRAYYEKIHHRRFSIEILAVQALLEEAQGDRASALSTLAQALRLAEPGGFIRLFLDLGPGLAPLLDRCAQGHAGSAYAARLLDALTNERSRMTGNSTFPQSSSALLSPQHGLIEALTNRELDMLDLLAQRFQNQEIAERLCISPRTVKKHLYNLYQKLNVHGRREAVVKAMELALIPERE